MLFTNNTITECTINDAWRSALWLCVREGEETTKIVSSYEAHKIRQLPTISIHVSEPWTRPLAVVMPEFLPAVTSEDAIEKYFMDYLLTDRLLPNEEYTYGQFLADKFDYIIAVLNATQGHTNQATINIGHNSVNYTNPPCLRVVDFKVHKDKLYMHLFFRSWDLLAGLPQNLGGLQLLKEYVLQHLTFPAADGPIIAHASGGHIYQSCYGLVNALCVDKIPK